MIFLKSGSKSQFLTPSLNKGCCGLNEGFLNFSRSVWLFKVSVGGVSLLRGLFTKIKIVHFLSSR